MHFHQTCTINYSMLFKAILVFFHLSYFEIQVFLQEYSEILASFIFLETNLKF